MAAASVSAIPPHIEKALKRAARATGADFDYLLKTARRESSLKPGARAKTSSAAGLFQFIEQTWLATLKTAGPKHGLTKISNLITRNAAGRLDVADPAMRRAVLALRFDPKLSSVMAGEFTAQNAAVLKANIGRKPSDGELYIGHFLGAPSASRLIKLAQSAPQSVAANHFTRAAKANRPIFYTRSGRARTVSEVYQNLTRHYDRQLADVRTGAAKGKAPLPENVPQGEKSLKSQPLRPLTHALFTIWQTPLDDPGRNMGTSAFHNLFLPGSKGAAADRTGKYREARAGHLPTQGQLLAAFGLEGAAPRKTPRTSPAAPVSKVKNTSDAADAASRRISDLWGRTSPARRGILGNRNPGGI